MFSIQLNVAENLARLLTLIRPWSSGAICKRSTKSPAHLICLCLLAFKLMFWWFQSPSLFLGPRMTCKGTFVKKVFPVLPLFSALIRSSSPDIFWYHLSHFLPLPFSHFFSLPVLAVLFLVITQMYPILLLFFFFPSEVPNKMWLIFYYSPLFALLCLVTFRKLKRKFKERGKGQMQITLVVCKSQNYDRTSLAWI